MDRRQKIVDWLRAHGNPRAESLLNSLNQMNLDDWEQKHRDDLRKMEGWVNYETATKPLRDRARGEFDSYTDNPEWYIKGKAAKLGVNIEDLKKTLGELEEERIWNEGRNRRAKEVNDEFIWNFAPKSSQQRYIDDPNATIFGKEGKYNPYSKEGQDDLRDVMLGVAGTVGDFIPGYGAAVGPAARLLRNEELIRTKSKYAPTVTDAGKELLNDAATFAAAAWLQNFRTAKRMAAGAEKNIPFMENINKNARVTSTIDETKKSLDNIYKANSYEDLVKTVENMPEGNAKAALQKKISEFDDFGNKAAEQRFILETKREAVNHQMNLESTLTREPGGYVVNSKEYTKDLIRNAGGKVDDAERAINETKSLRQQVKNTPTIGKVGQIVRDKVLPVYGGLEQGLAKNATTLYKAGPADKDRAKIDWYKQNYLKDWQELNFKPQGKETDPIVRAYKELVDEGLIKPKGITTAEIFGE